MSGENIAAAQRAARAALDQVLDGVWFAVVAGSHEARLAFPQSPEPTMVRMDARTRAEAKAAVTGFHADGGTAMGTWLRLATRLFAGVPSATQRHAILLTDGINQHETPEQLLVQRTGQEVAAVDRLEPAFDRRLLEARGRRRVVARVGAAGGPGALRAPGVADRGGPHDTAAGRQRVDRGLPDGRLG